MNRYYDDVLTEDLTDINNSSSVRALMQAFKIWHPNWVKLVPNETNLRLFKISFSTFWLA